MRPEDIDDAIQEGYIGIIKASKKFSKGRSKFSTYIYRSIEWQILKFLKKELKYKKTIESCYNRPTISKVDYQYNEIKFDLSQQEYSIFLYKTQYKYTFQEIATISGISKSSIYRIYKKALTKICYD